MLMAYGCLPRIFKVFEIYRIPIDMIATSEVSVSLTIDDASPLREIARVLKKFGTVEVESPQ